MVKNFLVVFLFAFLTFGCSQDEIRESYLTPEGDTLDYTYIVGNGHVGELNKGADVSQMYKVFGETYVKLLKSPIVEERQDSSEVVVHKYYVYNNSNQLLFVAFAKDGEDEEPINLIVLKDKLFQTPDGIGINSSVDQIREVYPDANVVYARGDFYIFVPSYDLYFGISHRSVKGYDPEFVADIPIDSIVGNTRPSSMAVSWHIHEKSIFAPQFWSVALHKVTRWLVTELPSILIIIVMFILLRRLLGYIIRRVSTIASNHVAKDNSIDSHEALKRLTTITNIIHGVGEILLWCIFLLMILSKVNINIGPILASAGIVGLAVGFGAQELVRDFISGFFILLENQLRTGDMAIINDVMGLVEKIELRTVTLRDPSGVVHIFQNGKINSLANMTKEWSAMVIDIGVAYKEDVDHCMDVMKDVGAELRASEKYGELMLADIDILGVDSFGDSAIIIKMIVKTRPMQQWVIKREYLRRLKIRFDAEGIEIPFPHLSIYTGENTKPMPMSFERSGSKSNK